MADEQNSSKQKPILDFVVGSSTPKKNNKTRQSDNNGYAQLFKHDRFSMIVLDEAQLIRNPQTLMSLSILRLCVGKKASPELRQIMAGKAKKKRMRRASKELATTKKPLDLNAEYEDEDYDSVFDEDGEEIIDDAPTEKRRRSFFDMLIDCPNEGSRKSYRLLLSGTFVVNSVIDLMIHAMVLDANFKCETHNETHRFTQDKFWKKYIFPMRGKNNLRAIKEIDLADGRILPAKDYALEIYKEFVDRHFLSYDEEYVNARLNLPPKHVETVKLNFHGYDKQRIIYERLVQSFTDLVDKYELVLKQKNDYEKGTVKILKDKILLFFHYLVLAGNHPACIRGELTRKGNPMAKYNAILLKELQELGIEEMTFKEPSVKTDELYRRICKIKNAKPKAKIVVFSSFCTMLDILYYQLRSKGFKKDKMSRYYGNLRKDIKTKELENFRTGPADILFTTFKTGGLGLNLSEANHVFVVDMPFTPAEWDQGVGRVQRIPQQEQVYVYDFLLEYSVDVWRLAKNAQKAQLLREWRTQFDFVIENRVNHYSLLE